MDVLLAKSMVHLVPVAFQAILLINLGFLALGRLGLGWIGQTVAAVIACPIVMLILIYSGIAPSDLTYAKYPDPRDILSPFIAAFVAGFVGSSVQVLLLFLFKGSER